MLVRINRALRAKSGKPYAKSLLGKVMFSNDVELIQVDKDKKDVDVVKGMWAVCTSVVQTKTKDEKGNLVDFPEGVEKPILSLIQAVFATKPEAIAAIIDEQSGDTDLVAEMEKVVKGFTIADLKAMESSAI